MGYRSLAEGKLGYRSLAEGKRRVYLDENFGGGEN